MCKHEKRFEREDLRLKRFILQLGFSSATLVNIDKFLGVLPIRKTILAKPLWMEETCSTTPLFLEASLHLDNYIALKSTRRSLDYLRTAEDDSLKKPCFYGRVLEFERKMLQGSDHAVNWTPRIPTLENNYWCFSMSEQLHEGLLQRKGGPSTDLYTRLLWEMQSSLLDRTNDYAQLGRHTSTMPETMMLMVLRACP